MARALVTVAALLMITGCASTAPSTPATRSYNKPEFVTELRDGRLWVFREGSAELVEFRQQGELDKSVTRVGGGPNGMTIRAADVQTLDAYMAK